MFHYYHGVAPFLIGDDVEEEHERRQLLIGWNSFKSLGPSHFLCFPFTEL